jgi:hypothetical protein
MVGSQDSPYLLLTSKMKYWKMLEFQEEQE